VEQEGSQNLLFSKQLHQQRAGLEALALLRAQRAQARNHVRQAERVGPAQHAAAERREAGARFRRSRRSRGGGVGQEGVLERTDVAEDRLPRRGDGDPGDAAVGGIETEWQDFLTLPIVACVPCVPPRLDQPWRVLT